MIRLFNEKIDKQNRQVQGQGHCKTWIKNSILKTGNKNIKKFKKYISEDISVLKTGNLKTIQIWIKVFV